MKDKFLIFFAYMIIIGLVNFCMIGIISITNELKDLKIMIYLIEILNMLLVAYGLIGITGDMED